MGVAGSTYIASNAANRVLSAGRSFARERRPSVFAFAVADVLTRVRFKAVTVRYENEARTLSQKN
jgi:hypothetical protein